MANENTYESNKASFVGSQPKIQALQKLDKPVFVMHKNVSKTPLLKKSAKKAAVIGPNMQSMDMPAMSTINTSGFEEGEHSSIENLSQMQLQQQ